MKIIDMAKFYFGQYKTLKINVDYAMGLRMRSKVYKSLEEFLTDWGDLAEREVIRTCFEIVYTGYSEKHGKSIPIGDCEVPHIYLMYK